LDSYPEINEDDAEEKPFQEAKKLNRDSILDNSG